MIEELANIHLYNFKMLETIPDIEEPTFTFSHIIPPHHPYLFSKDGSIKSHASRLEQFKKNKWDKRKEYIEQLIFVNTKIKKVINIILDKSVVPPIIIVQSDHGPQLPGEKTKDFKAWLGE